jgi:hypothetical protein
VGRAGDSPSRGSELRRGETIHGCRRLTGQRGGSQSGEHNADGGDSNADSNADGGDGNTEDRGDGTEGGEGQRREGGWEGMMGDKEENQHISCSKPNVRKKPM